jgi:erythromycin esterase
MRLRSLSLLLVLSLLTVADAAPRRRAVRFPTSDLVTPEGWLRAKAMVLDATELVPSRVDLAPLGRLIGDRTVVALGDGTHGTHEFYTVKLRIIDYLVREKGFDVLAIEAPFATFNAIDAYVQGGPGDARKMVADIELTLFPFWNAEEILQVVEWMREYNAHRGERPAVHFAGMDVFEPIASSNAVLSYLRTVDPALSVTAENGYACVRAGTRAEDCWAGAARLRDAIAAHEVEYTSRSSTAAFHDALQHARVVVQSRFQFGAGRDAALAENALWMRAHRGTSGKTILWGHNAHISEVGSPFALQPMGAALKNALGEDYFTIGTMASSGTFLLWLPLAKTPTFARYLGTLGPVQEGSYESYFQRRGANAFIVPLTDPLPAWFPKEAPYNVAGSSGGGPYVSHGKLAEQFDAVVYIESTTPIRPLN